jgi:predicted metal-dependent phosphoesterase TrpH
VTIDLHTHSNISDGTDDPAELVYKAADAGLTAIALTDHDTFDGLQEAAAAADQLGLTLVPGVEISCRWRGASVHLLGYAPGPSDVLDAELRKARESREHRLGALLARLDELGMPLSTAEVMEYVGRSPSIGRPHIADAMVARGYVENRDEAFRDWLRDGGPAYVDRYAVPLERAVEIVTAAGGAAVVAHPWGRGGQGTLTADVLDRLTGLGLVGIEVDHPDHDAATRSELRRIAAELGLLATGASDHHGLGKTNNDLGCETTSLEVFEALTAPLDLRARMLS